MGRHAAGDGASAHPMVAAALAHSARHGAHRHGAETAIGQGGLGWPGPPPGGDGIGWPADESAEAARPAEEPVPAGRPG